MIYILAGNDNKGKSAFTKSLIKGHDSFPLQGSEVSIESLHNYAGGVSLFGDTVVVILDNVLSSGDITLLDEDFKKLKDSQTIFIFLEDKLLVSNEKKYKKYAEIKRFEDKKVAASPKFNTFVIADAFGRHDKVEAWIAYREAIESGIDPEPISGILFWKIKTMQLANPRPEFKKQSGELVSLYHRAHRGECDFVIGLEQFILSSLSK